MTNNGDFKGHFYGVYVVGEIGHKTVEFYQESRHSPDQYYKKLINLEPIDITNNKLYVTWDTES